MNWDAIEGQAQTNHLTILGGFHPTVDDATPDGCKTVLLLGPHEPYFWPAFSTSKEYIDKAPDPLDRWSTRVVGRLANDLNATALFPFGGAPYHPFYSWALRTGRIHAAPINFLVHDVAGLFVSFRGALCLSEKIDLPHTPPNPCSACIEKPCQVACPVDALTPKGYDVTTCKAYLATPDGTDCVTNGCAVRRACPVSQEFGRLPVQSEFHMQAFKGD